MESVSASQRRGSDVSPGGDTTPKARPPTNVHGNRGRFSVYFAPWAADDGASQWLTGFETAEKAMDATDRCVAGYVDAAGE
jgi:hypothetical protein